MKVNELIEKILFKECILAFEEKYSMKSKVAFVIIFTIFIHANIVLLFSGVYVTTDFSFSIALSVCFFSVQYSTDHVVRVQGFVGKALAIVASHLGSHWSTLTLHTCV